MWFFAAEEFTEYGFEAGSDVGSGCGECGEVGSVRGEECGVVGSVCGEECGEVGSVCGE